MKRTGLCGKEEGDETVHVGWGYEDRIGDNEREGQGYGDWGSGKWEGEGWWWEDKDRMGDSERYRNWKVEWK